MYIALGMNHTSGIFMTIVAVSWIAISIYSIDYGKFYSKDMVLWLNLSIFSMMIILMAKDGLTSDTLARLVTTFGGVFIALAIGMAAFSMVKIIDYTFGILTIRKPDTYHPQ